MKIQDNKIAFISEYDKMNFRDILSVKSNAKLELSIRTGVTDHMRGYYYGGVLLFIHKIGMYPQLAKLEFSNTNQEIYHELLKQEFNGIDILDANGNNKRVGMSIMVKDSELFTEYLLRINEYVLENFGMNIPTSDEYLKAEGTIGPNDTFTDYYIRKNRKYE